MIRILALLALLLSPVGALAQPTVTHPNALNLVGTTLASSVVTSSLTSVGTLTGGATGAGFTIALTTSTVTGTIPSANVSGSYTGITGLGTVTAGTWTASVVGLTYGGTNNALTASNGGIVYSDASKLNILAGTVTASQCLLSGSSSAPTWGSCSGAAAVSAVSNSDGTLTISPTTGSVVASLALGNANTWTAAQTFNSSDLILKGSSTGTTTFASGNSSGTSYTITVPAATGTMALTSGANVASVTNSDGTLTISPTTGAVVASLALGHANTWAAAQTFTNSDLKLLGSSTGLTTFTSANAGASNFTINVPATNSTDTLAVLGAVSQVMAGGVHLTSYSIGTVTGSTTIDCGNNPNQYFTNGGAVTIVAPSNDSNCLVLMKNNASAVIPLYSGFTVGTNTGDTVTATNNSQFLYSIARINGVATYVVKALQP